MDIKISKHLKNLAKIIKPQTELYIVGGYVRNAILRLEQTDIDLASRLTPEKLETLLSGTEFKVKEKSKRLGTVLIVAPNGEKWEHTTFRQEIYPDSGAHTPDRALFIDDIHEDAKRRDFTVNAIYYNILKDEVVDTYMGVEDLEAKRIKCVESPEYVFESDGLRILRMIRFCAELNFKPEKDTYRSAVNFAYKLKDITNTRKLAELELILNSSEKYGISRKGHMRGLKLINKIKAWPNFFIQVGRVKYNMVKKSSPENRFLGLVIDIIDSEKPANISHYLNFLLSPTCFPVGKKAAENYRKIILGYYAALSRTSNKKFFFEYYSHFPEASQFLDLSSKKLNAKYTFFYNYINTHKLAICIADLKINGDDLKKRVPKLNEKKYGIVLNDLLEKVFDGKLQNNKGELIREVQKNVGNY